MPTDLIRYDLLVQDALRFVVRRVLTDAARNGLPGEHHFNITFKTQAGGVVVPAAMRQKYPDEMTIILQHQFWGLKIDEEHFEVTLTFKKLPATLSIPFSALTAFFDPGVQFGLQFRGDGDAKTTTPHMAPVASQNDAPGEKVTGMTPKPADPAHEKPAAPGEVVSLDTFRKK